MIYPDIGVDEWLCRTGLSVEDYVCCQCKKTIPIDVPVITKDYFGLESKEHSCGPGFKGHTYIARSEKKRKLWEYISAQL